MPTTATATATATATPDRRRTIRLALLSEARERFALEQRKLSVSSSSSAAEEGPDRVDEGGDAGAAPRPPPPLLAAPISPTPQSLISSVLPALGLTDESLLIDVGCGDGRWMVEAASETGCRCVGCDFDAGRLAAARGEVARLGLEDRVELRRGDAFEFVRSARDDARGGGRPLVEAADVVVLYLFREAMRRMSTILTEKLLGGGGGDRPVDRGDGPAEGLSNGKKKKATIIVCVGFALPNWRPVWQRTFEGLRVYVYSTLSPPPILE